MAVKSAGAWQIILLLLAIVSVDGEEPSGVLQDVRQLLASKTLDSLQARVLLMRLNVPVKQQGWEEARFLNAEIRFRLGQEADIEQAQKDFRLLSDDAATPWKARGLMGLFRVQALDPAKWASAATQFERLLPKLTRDRDPASVDAAFHLAQLRESLGDIKAARSAFEHAARMLAEVRAYWGSNLHPGLISERDIQDALARLQPPPPKTVDKPETEPEETFQRAEDAKKQGRLDEAYALFAKVVEFYPKHKLAALSRLRLAEVELLRAKVSKAKKILESFLRDEPLGPYRGQAHLLLGDIFLEHEFRAPEAANEYAAILKPAGYAVLTSTRRAAPSPLRMPSSAGREVKASPVSGGDPLMDEARLSADPAYRKRLFDEDLPAGVDSSWGDVLPDTHIRMGMIEYLNGNFGAADRHFTRAFLMRPDQQFGKGAPFGPILLAEQCRMKRSVLPEVYLRMGNTRATVCLFLAQAYLTAWQHEKAVALFKRVFDGEFKDANAEQKGYALSQYGEAVWYLGRESEAWKAWGAFLKPPYSRLREAPSALLSFACTQFTQTQDPKWIPYLERVYRDYPQSEWAPHAMIQHYNLLFDDEPEAALQLLKTLSYRYPDYCKRIPYDEYVKESTKRSEVLRKAREEPKAAR